MRKDLVNEFKQKLIVDKNDSELLPAGTVLESLSDGRFWKVYPGYFVSIENPRELFCRDGDTRVGEDEFVEDTLFYTFGPFKIVGMSLSVLVRDGS